MTPTHLTRTRHGARLKRRCNPLESADHSGSADFALGSLSIRLSTLAATGLLASGLVVAACGSGSGTPQPSARSLFQQGLAAQGHGKLEEARRDYAKVLALDPTNRSGNNKFAYYNVGVIDQQQNNAVAAATEYRRALLVDPNFVDALYNLAIVETPGSPQQAILLYQQVLGLAPNDANTLYNLGLLLYQTGQIDQGKALLRHAIQIAPSLTQKLPSSVKL